MTQHTPETEDGIDPWELSRVLLAALEELQEAIDAIDETNDGAAWHRVAVAQGKARAAIAQAKGE